MLLNLLAGSYAYRSASALGIELIAFGGGSNRLAGSWRGACSERPAALLPAEYLRLLSSWVHTQKRCAALTGHSLRHPFPKWWARVGDDFLHVRRPI